MRGCKATEGEEVIGVRIGILVFIITVGLTGSISSGAAATSGPAAQKRSTAPAAPESCPYAQIAVSFYRGRFVHHQLQRGASVPKWRKPRNCADAQYLAYVWAKRAHKSKQQTGLWREAQRAKRELHDFEVRPGNNAWRKAVREVQKVFPGTESWLLSCSGAEGGHGRWVTYGGGSDWQWAMDNYVVGGWMQFKYPTFAGMFRHAVAHLSARGYLIPVHLKAGGGTAWRSALAQALAAGWARFTGADGSHWSASWNRGCS